MHDFWFIWRCDGFSAWCELNGFQVARGLSLIAKTVPVLRGISAATEFLTVRMVPTKGTVVSGRFPAFCVVHLSLSNYLSICCHLHDFLLLLPLLLILRARRFIFFRLLSSCLVLGKITHPRISECCCLQRATWHTNLSAALFMVSAYLLISVAMVSTTVRINLMKLAALVVFFF